MPSASSSSRVVFRQRMAGRPDFTCHLEVSRCHATVAGRRRCARRTFRHPFCLQHARALLGLEVRTSPVHGCGLFATRLIKRDDVLAPYTGRWFPSAQAFLQSSHGRPSTPYAFQLQGGELVDASCLRGLGAYANQAPRGQGPNNTRVSQATVRHREDRHFFSARADADGMLTVLSSAAAGAKSPFHARRWGRIPRALVSHRFPETYQWLVATRDIPPGCEIFLDYRTSHRGLVHSTDPRPCKLTAGRPSASSSRTGPRAPRCGSPGGRPP